MFLIAQTVFELKIYLYSIYFLRKKKLLLPIANTHFIYFLVEINVFFMYFAITIVLLLNLNVFLYRNELTYQNDIICL